MQDGGFIGRIPLHMRYQDQRDDIVEVKDANDWIMLSNMPDEYKNIAVRITGEDVHMMNKLSILRNYRSIMRCMA
jgi:hypothetical protein